MNVIEQQYFHQKFGIYLDFAGAMPLCEDQNKLFSKLVQDNFGNIHSKEQVSAPANQMEDLRSYICSMFSTNTIEYSVVFTHNTTHSLQILADLLSFNENTDFYYFVDNHNSVFGLRTAASQKNSSIKIVNNLPSKIDKPDSYFAYPCQSNFSGKKYPLEWISEFQKLGGTVILDAACSYCPSLSTHKPDFVSASLLKLVGIHGGILLIRKDRIKDLKDPLPAGGTVNYTCPRSGKYDLLPNIQTKLESGTPSYLDLMLALEGCTVRRSIGTEKEIEQNILNLSKILEDKLNNLVHSNGRHLVEFQPKRDSSFGGTFSFNLFTVDGKLINHHDIQYCFSVFRVAARFGGHCNSGSAEIALGWEDDDIVSAANKLKDSPEKSCLSSQCVIDGRPIGTIRFSLGASSTIDDIEKISELLRNQFVNGGPCPKDELQKVNPMKVESIFVYPVVGTLGFEVKKWKFTDRGLKYDRMWKLMSADGVTVNLTACTSLAQIEAVIDEKSDELILKHTSGDILSLPINNIKPLDNCPEELSKNGIVYDQSVSDWLFKHVGRFLYLVKVGYRDGGRMAFSSISKETFETVGSDYDLERFRINILFSGGVKYGEQAKQFNGLKLNGLKVIRWRPRVICMMTTVKPHDGSQRFDVLQRLSRERGKYGIVELGSLFSVDCEGIERTLSVGDVIAYD